MEPDFEHLDEQRPESRAKLLEALGESSRLRRDYHTWLAMEASIRRQLEDAVGDHETFVLFAMEQAGRGDDLSAAEREKVDRARTRFEEAVALHPGLADIIRRIQGEADQFDLAWRQSSLTSEAAIDNRPVSRGSSPRGRYMRYAWRGVAVLAALTFVGVLLLVGRKDTNRVKIAAEDGLIRQVAFADGSMVRLVGPAEVSYSKTVAEAERPQVVRLAGHAYFDIVATETPFVVETATARVSVLGTNFGLRAEDDKTEVILVSGRLAVASRDHPTTARTITAGQSCTVDRGHLPGEAIEVDLTEALAWANLFVFRGTPMRRVAAILSDHYGLSIELDPSLSAQGIHGTFDRQQDLAEILEALATTLSADMTTVGDTTFRISERK